MSIRQRLKRVEADTTADGVYEVLRQCIVEGDFAPGQRLLSDALATELKVSRTPVREALRKLEAEGLVEASGRAGLTVRAISEEDLSELFYVREALEGMAARLAAENASEAATLDLHALLDEMAEALAHSDLKLIRALTGEFHMAVCRASRNKRLMHSLKILLDQVRQVQTSTLFLEGRAADAIDEHRRLVEAIESRDSDLAEQIARRHRQKTLRLRREMIREQARRNRPSTVNEGRSGE
jgi:DNA-binding GntR family transcriptional regulator